MDRGHLFWKGRVRVPAEWVLFFGFQRGNRGSTSILKTVYEGGIELRGGMREIENLFFLCLPTCSKTHFSCYVSPVYGVRTHGERKVSGGMLDAGCGRDGGRDTRVCGLLGLSNSHRVTFVFLSGMRWVRRCHSWLTYRILIARRSRESIPRRR